MFCRTLALATSVVVLAPHQATAQTADLVPAPGDPRAATVTQPAEKTAAPQLPQVEDPMLIPPERPANVLRDWRQALRLVRARSTSLATAQAQVSRAAAQSRNALVRAYPKLSANGSVNRHLLFGTGTNITAEGPQINVSIPDPAAIWRANLSFRQPLLALRAWHDVETARIGERAASYRQSDAERLVLASVADAIVAVFTAERLAEVNRVALRSSLSILDLTKRRARLGASTAVDVLRSEQEASINRAQVVSSTEALHRAREALGMALGYSKPWGVTSDIKLDDLAKDAAQVCSPVVGIDQRSDIQAAVVERAVAERNAESPRYDLAPSLDLVSDLTYTTSSFTSNGKPIQWTIGAILSVPLYDGGARYGQMQANRAATELASQQLIQARRQAGLELRQAKRSVEVALQNLEISTRSRDLSRETARLSRLSYVNGKGTSFELVDATRRQQQAELDLAVKEFEVIRAKIIALLAAANCDI